MLRHAPSLSGDSSSLNLSSTVKFLEMRPRGAVTRMPISYGQTGQQMHCPETYSEATSLPQTQSRLKGRNGQRRGSQQWRRRNHKESRPKPRSTSTAVDRQSRCQCVRESRLLRRALCPGEGDILPYFYVADMVNDANCFELIDLWAFLELGDRVLQ